MSLFFIIFYDACESVVGFKPIEAESSSDAMWKHVNSVLTEEIQPAKGWKSCSVISAAGMTTAIEEFSQSL